MFGKRLGIAASLNDLNRNIDKRVIYIGFAIFGDENKNPGHSKSRSGIVTHQKVQHQQGGFKWNNMIFN